MKHEYIKVQSTFFGRDVHVEAVRVAVTSERNIYVTQLGWGHIPAGKEFLVLDTSGTLSVKYQNRVECNQGRLFALNFKRPIDPVYRHDVITSMLPILDGHVEEHYTRIDSNVIAQWLTKVNHYTFLGALANCKDDHLVGCILGRMDPVTYREYRFSLALLLQQESGIYVLSQMRAVLSRMYEMID